MLFCAIIWPCGIYPRFLRLFCLFSRKNLFIQPTCHDFPFLQREVATFIYLLSSPKLFASFQNTSPFALSVFFPPVPLILAALESFSLVPLFFPLLPQSPFALRFCGHEFLVPLFLPIRCLLSLSSSPILLLPPFLFQFYFFPSSLAPGPRFPSGTGLSPAAMLVHLCFPFSGIQAFAPVFFFFSSFLFPFMRHVFSPLSCSNCQPPMRGFCSCGGLLSTVFRSPVIPFRHHLFSTFPPQLVPLSLYNMGGSFASPSLLCAIFCTICPCPALGLSFGHFAPSC